MLQESAAVRVATLGVALLTAFAVCSAADKEIKIKILITATWRVSCHKLNCLPKLLMSQSSDAVLRVAFGAACFLEEKSNDQPPCYRWCTLQKASYQTLACLRLCKPVAKQQRLESCCRHCGASPSNSTQVTP